MNTHTSDPTKIRQKAACLNAVGLLHEMKGIDGGLAVVSNLSSI